MTSELYALAVLVLMQMVLGLAATAAVARKVSNAWLFSSRSVPQDFRDSLGGRLDRARANGFEAITYFAPLALIVAVAGLSTPVTATAAWVYVAARALYWACYAADLVPWRTIVWFIGWIALLVLVLAVLTG